MKLVIELNLDNDAFVDHRCNDEIRKCLNQIVDKLDNEQYSGVMRDTNGNKVGWFDIEVDESYEYQPMESAL